MIIHRRYYNYDDERVSASYTAETEYVESFDITGLEEQLIWRRYLTDEEPFEPLVIG